MSFHVDDNTVAMWCIELPGRNVLGHLGRGPNGKFLLDYRFRHYVDDKIHNSADVRNWYHGELSGTQEEVLEKTKHVFTMLCLVARSHWWLERGAMTADEFTAVLISQPGMHADPHFLN